MQGFRNEDLEALTFPDASFDLTVTLDVMEHVNQPDVVLREVARTLRPGGAYLFTVPTYKGKSRPSGGRTSGPTAASSIWPSRNITATR